VAAVECLFGINALRNASRTAESRVRVEVVDPGGRTRRGGQRQPRVDAQHRQRRLGRAWSSFATSSETSSAKSSATAASLPRGNLGDCSLGGNRNRNRSRCGYTTGSGGDGTLDVDVDVDVEPVASAGSVNTGPARD